MERIDAIFALDCMQASDEALRCTVDDSHGKLMVTGRMSFLCQIKGCPFPETPATVELIATASERYRRDREHMMLVASGQAD